MEISPIYGSLLSGLDVLKSPFIIFFSFNTTLNSPHTNTHTIWAGEELSWFSFQPEVLNLKWKQIIQGEKIISE